MGLYLVGALEAAAGVLVTIWVARVDARALADEQATLAAASDLEMLRSVTASNITHLRRHTILPVAGGLHLRRNMDAALADVSPADGGILVVGDAGSGKTGLVVTLAAARLDAGQDVVVLRAADLAAAPALGGAVLSRPLTKVLLDWPGIGPATLIIDALTPSARQTLAQHE